MGRRKAAVLLCAALLFSACGNDAAPQSTAADTVPDPGRDFSITARDGTQLEARAFGNSDRYVILAHMRPADMTSWFDFARVLADEGYTAVAFNFRGYGGSEGVEGDFSVDLDVRGAVDAALDAGASEVFIIGASMGGTGAVAASAIDEIAAIVTLSAPDEFEGVNAANLARSVESPILLIAADQDGTAAEDASAIAAEAQGETELIVLSGDQHGTNLFTEHGEELTKLILDFLAAA